MLEDYNFFSNEEKKKGGTELIITLKTIPNHRPDKRRLPKEKLSSAYSDQKRDLDRPIHLNFFA